MSRKAIVYVVIAIGLLGLWLGKDDDRSQLGDPDLFTPSQDTTVSANDEGVSHEIENVHRRSAGTLASTDAVGLERIVIQDHRGNAIVGAQCALIGTDGMPRWARTTDDRGEIVVEVMTTFRTLLVNADGHAPLLVEVPQAQSPIYVSLAFDSAVTGRALLNGHPVPRPLLIELQSDLPVLSEENLEPEALFAVGIVSLSTFYCRTDATGSFYFLGLPTDLRGSLACLDQEYVAQFQDDNYLTPSRLAVPAPAQGITIPLRRILCVRGKILLADGVTPMSRGYMKAVVHSPTGNQIVALHQDSELEGEFILPIRGHTVEEFSRVDVSAHPEHAPECVWSFTPPPPGLDVGVLSLPPDRVCHINVCTSDGDPIADAAVYYAGGMTPAVLTDERGFARLSIYHHACLLLVEAVGFTPAEVQVPAGSVAVAQRVELSNSATVQIEFVDSEGKPTSAAVAQLSGDAIDSLPAPWGIVYPARVARGANEGSVVEGERNVWQLEPDSTGVIQVYGLPGGDELLLQVVPKSGLPLEPVSLGVLQPGATIVRRYVIPASEHSLSGRVLGEGGSPVPHSSVTIFAGPSSGHRKLCESGVDERGNFSCELRYEGPVLIRVTAAGYAQYQASMIDLPTSEALLIIQLERGREIHVVVEDNNKAPLPAVVWASAETYVTMYGKKSAEGSYTISNAPMVPLQITAFVGGVQYHQRCELHAQTVRFLLPDHGYANLTYSGQYIQPRRAIQLVLIDSFSGNVLSLAVSNASQRIGPIAVGSYHARLQGRDSFDRPWENLTVARSITITRDQEASLDFLGD